MGRTITRARANALERASYLEAGVTAQAGIDEAIRLLRFQEIAGAFPDGQGSDALRTLRMAKAGIEAELIGFLSGSFQFRVPEPDILAEIGRLSHALFETMPDESADEILRRARSLLLCWGRTRLPDLRMEPGPSTPPKGHEPSVGSSEPHPSFASKLGEVKP